MPLSKNTIGVLAAVITIAIWSGFIIIARAMAFKTLTPFDIVFARLIGAGCVLVPWGIWWVRRARARDPDAQSWLGIAPVPFRLAATIGIFGGVAYPLIAYTGFFYAPAAHAAVLMPGFLPLWTALLAAIVLGTPIPARRRIGLALIVSGGLLVGGASLLQAFDGGTVWVGDVLYLAGSLVWALYTVTLRKHAVAAIPATIAITVFALATFAPTYLLLAATGLVQSKLAVAPWSELAFQAVAQGIFSVVISGITFVRMVEHFGPVRSTMLTAIVPGLAAIGAAIFLNEPLHWNVILGLAAVTIGITFGVKPAAPATQSALKGPR